MSQSDKPVHEIHDTIDADVVVQAANLGKCYRIFERPQDRLKQSLFLNRRQYYREFWALRHVDFELRRGETLAIIGRNGSGKSTLLQLLCGTLTPTEGSRLTRGRLAALLELGSGFNPDFTGLENVFLYASLLGLKREDTQARLDSILSFADIGDFVRQPVKTYSSGMAVRLAFAVIANVDADILVVDEALSVGDVFFVQKCMRFIKRFKEQNTLILVTHDSQAALSICSHGLVLSNGHMITQKISAKKAVQAYINAFNLDTSISQAESPANGEDLKRSHQAGDALGTRDDVGGESLDVGSHVAPLILHGQECEDGEIYQQQLKVAIDEALVQGRTVFSEITEIKGSPEHFNGECKIKVIQISNVNPAKAALLAEGERVVVSIQAECLLPFSSPIIGFLIKDRNGLAILGENTVASGIGSQLEYEPGDTIEASFTFTMPRISPGQYAINVAIAKGTQENNVQMHYFHEICAFEVVSLRPCHALTCPSDMTVEVS